MTLPPYAALLGVTRADSSDATGGPTLAMPFGDVVLGRPDFLHGGAIAGLLDLAARAALDAALADPDIAVVPVTVTTDYRRGGRGVPTFAQGTVTRLGTRIANVAATAWQDDPDRPIATAQVTYRLARP